MSKFSTWLNSLTADATPDTAADYLVTYDASAATSKKLLLSVLLALASGGSGVPADGWVAAGETWTYVSADGPTGVFSVPADVTGKYQPGMRVKYTQTTVKYGIITAVGAFAAGVTPITIYGGTDYTLANAAITLPFYSTVKAPFGFPMSPAKWTVEVTDTTLRSQSSPTTDTWYNLGSVTISLPIGLWTTEYEVTPQINMASAVDATCQVTLSTANNSESDFDLTSSFNIPLTSVKLTLFRKKLLNLAAKTSYYLNTRSCSASTSSIHNVNASANQGAPLFVRAVCAYL